MTDHLADARACIQSAAQSPDAGGAISWLTATCEQIIAHLEAQKAAESLRRGLADIAAGRTVDLGTFAQPATAPSAAQQGDSGHRDGGEAARPNLNLQTGYTAVQAAMAVLCDEGADSEGGWHSWRCFDRERYPEPCDCTEQVTRAAIAAAEPHVRAKIAGEIAECRRAITTAQGDEFGHVSTQIGWLTAGYQHAEAIARREQP